MMRRREFIMLLGTVAWPIAARAQRRTDYPEFGFLATGSLELPATRDSFNAFRQGLRELL